MAIIKCIDCGKDISDKAKICIHCGCPIEEEKTNGLVRIKMPQPEAFFTAAEITDINGNVLWSGKLGQVAEFYLDEKTTVIINCGSLTKPFEAEIDPKGNPKFAVVLQGGIHWKSHYMLNRVDFIDSE